LSEVQNAIDILRPVEHILVFTGAGISTESGIPDFRGPDGLWTKVDPDDFHIESYLTNRHLRVRGWQMHLSGELWGVRSTVKPNPGHYAIARLAEKNRLAGVVTQNIDGLHLAAGLDDDQVAELHGSGRESYCLKCGTAWPTETVLEWVESGADEPTCPNCGGMVKTRTVMFGEALPEMEVKKANLFLALADAVLVAGSTVAVWPASDVVMRAAMRPIPIVIINRGETEADDLADLKIDAGIGETLPQIVEGILA
jgi:NAD-dependent deacetylase